MIGFLTLLALALFTWVIARWTPSVPEVEDLSEDPPGTVSEWYIIQQIEE